MGSYHDRLVFRFSSMEVHQEVDRIELRLVLKAGKAGKAGKDRRPASAGGGFAPSLNPTLRDSKPLRYRNRILEQIRLGAS